MSNDQRIEMLVKAWAHLDAVDNILTKVGLTIERDLGDGMEKTAGYHFELAVRRIEDLLVDLSGIDPTVDAQVEAFTDCIDNLSGSPEQCREALIKIHLLE